MTRINTNVASLRGLRNLQKANSLLETSLTRLSTGIKINSGKDNPAGLIASETLRSQIVTIEQSIKNSNRANNVIGTADSALGEISGLLNQIRGLIQEGLNTGALSKSEIEANQLQIDAALSAINRISANTTFAGDKLIDGSKSFTTAISATNAALLDDFQINEAVFGSSATINIDATITQAAEQAELRYAGGSLTEDTTLEVSGSFGSQVLFLGGASSVANIRDAINAVSDTTGVQALVGSGLSINAGAVASDFDLQTAALAGASTFDAADTYAQSQFDSSGTDNIVLAARADGTAGNGIDIVLVDNGGNSSVTSIVSVVGNTITIELGHDGSALVGDADDIAAAIQGDTSADALLRVVSADGTNSDAFAASGTRVIGVGGDSGNVLGVDDSTETAVFTDARATATDGAAATLGGEIFIEFVNNTATGTAAASIASITTAGNGDQTITIELGDNGATGIGNTTSVLSDITSAITGNAAANALVSVGAGASTETFNVQGPTQLTGGADSELVTFERATAGSDATLGGTLSINFVDLVNADATTTATATTDANGDTVVTVELGDDGSAVTATLDDVIAAIAADQTLGGAAQFVTTIGSGSNTVLSVSGPSLLTGGTDGTNSGVSFTDVRADPSVGTLQVEFADPAAASQALSIVVNNPSGSDFDIIVNLATDANGDIISTAADVVAAINADSAANILVNGTADGDGTEVVADSGGLQAVAAGSGALQLLSIRYGKDEFVEINVLNGSFATTLNDGLAASSRDAGADIKAQINGQLAAGSGLNATVATATLNAQLSFDLSANVAGTTVSLTITGGGSLFQIGQDVSAAGQIGIGIDAINTARLGGITGKLFELGSGRGKSLFDVGPAVQGADLVNIVEESISRVSNLRGRLGALQKNVIETNISTLGAALENITEARSQIIDTDFAQETANLTRAQILSQAGISVLAIANQNPAQVLSLLG